MLQFISYKTRRPKPIRSLSRRIFWNPNLLSDYIFLRAISNYEYAEKFKKFQKNILFVVHFFPFLEARRLISIHKDPEYLSVLLFNSVGTFAHKIIQVSKKCRPNTWSNQTFRGKTFLNDLFKVTNACCSFHFSDSFSLKALFCHAGVIKPELKVCQLRLSNN